MTNDRRNEEEDSLIWEEMDLTDESLLSEDGGFDEYGEYHRGRSRDRRTDSRRRGTEQGRRERTDSRYAGSRYADRSVRDREGRKKKRKLHPFLLLLVFLIIALPLMFWIARARKQTLTAAGTTIQGYKNIALFGLDSTDGSLASGNNRSDIMIIASINEATGNVNLVSVYRDTYLDIGDGNYQKANAAYAYGGPTQAVSMINTNFDLDITDYVSIGFDGIASLIDAVGGVDIDITEEEIHYLNDYQSTMAQETGLQYIPVENAGKQTLTGLQAAAYCRIRYTDGGDFKRTERQKEVLKQTFAKIKSNPLTVIKAAPQLMTKIKTNLSLSDLISLAGQAVSLSIGDTTGVPTESLRTVGYVGDQSCVIPITLAANVQWLHQYLFGDTDYTVPQTVQDISDHISSVTGYY